MHFLLNKVVCGATPEGQIYNIILSSHLKRTAIQFLTATFGKTHHKAKGK